MSFIQREIDRIRADLIVNPDQRELYAAQQALCWALEPGGVRAPYAMIMGIEEAPEDCSAQRRPPQS